MDDSVPTGAAVYGTWTWDTNQKASGTQSAQLHSLTNADASFNTAPAMTTGASDNFFVYVHQPLRFPGQIAQDTGDVSYNIFRWYHSGWGRYTQNDPIRLRPVRYAGILLPAEAEFGYARGNPLTFTDARGLQAKPTSDCNYSRYKLCCNEGSFLKWCCKKYVDFGCSGEKNLVCCQNEYETCKACQDPESPDFAEHEAECHKYLVKCIAGQAKADCP